jgi:hypothetical protein
MVEYVREVLIPLGTPIFNTATPAANVDLIVDIVPVKNATSLRVTALFSAAGVLSVQLKQGAVTIVGELNSGQNLLADCLYCFTIPAWSDTTVNFRYSAGSGTTLLFKVDEEGEG